VIHPAPFACWGCPVTPTIPIPSEPEIRRLLDRHAPDLAGLSLRMLHHHGTDTVGGSCRGLTSASAAPRPDDRPGARNGSHMAAGAAPHLPLQVPEVIARGKTDPDPPIPWALYRWRPGRMPRQLTLTIRTTWPTGFPASSGLFRPSPCRSARRADGAGGLAPQDAALRAALARARVLGLEEALVARPVWEAGLADPAHELIPAWFVFDQHARGQFLATLCPNGATRAPGRSWPRNARWPCPIAATRTR